MKHYSEFVFGDMLLAYDLDDRRRVSMTLIPAAMPIPRARAVRVDRLTIRNSSEKKAIRNPFPFFSLSWNGR